MGDTCSQMETDKGLIVPSITFHTIARYSAGISKRLQILRNCFVSSGI